MKAILLPVSIALILLETFNNSFAQTWTAQLSGTTNDLYGVSFTDENNGTAVGISGTILRTTNGGTNWTIQTSGTTNDLLGVSFTDANNGTVVGAGGIILRTVNSGTNWAVQTSGTTNTLYGVFFTDINNGTAVGDNGTILKTTNGGSNWNSQSSGTTVRLRNVYFSDENNGTIVGYTGKILRSTNGGVNWTNQTSGTVANLWGVSFASINNGMAVGANGVILKTINGGTNWTTQTSGTSSNLWGVSFVDINNGTVVGFNGTILRTTNGGTNWIAQTSGTSNFLLSVSFIDTDIGITVGGVGTILRTNDGSLPVELRSFYAVINQGYVELNWNTVTEVNNYGFEVERTSSQNFKWEKICFVQGYGNSNSPKDYSFTDKPNGGCKFKYRLKQIDINGQYEYSTEVEVLLKVPADFSVKQNFPNPFNPTTKIEFSIPSDNNVEIKIFNLLGMEVATLLNEHKQTGTHSIEFSTIGGASELSSGIYFYKVVSGNYSKIKKMILLR
ncbi:MAG: YCF48-related protein [bacterium]